MPTSNPYEDVGLGLVSSEPVLPKPPGEAENPYEAIADSMIAQDKNDLRANLMADHAPDKAARALKLAPTQPYPREFTLRNVEEISKQQALELDLDALKDAPLTAYALRRDPILAAAARGDIQRIKELEQLFAPMRTGEILPRTLTQLPRALVQEGIPVIGEAAFRLSGIALDMLDEVLEEPVWAGEEPGYAGGKLRALADRSAEARSFFRPPPRDLVDRGLWAAGTSIPVSLMARGFGFATGAAAATQTLAAALAGGAVQLGQQYGEERGRDRGVGESLLRAAPSAAAEAAGELWPGHQLFKALEKASGLSLPDLGKNVLIENISEAGTFGLQTWDALLQGRTTTTKEAEALPGNLAELFIATTAGSAVQIGLARGMQEAAGRVERNAGQITDAQAANSAITKLMEAAKQIKLREAAPTELAKLVQSFADGNPEAPSALFVDSEDLAQVFEQSGMTEEQLATALPSLRAQGVHQHSGGTITLPIGELTAGVPGTPLEALLVPRLRATEDGLSAAQAEEAAKAAEEFVQKEAENVIKGAEDAQALQASADSVFTIMREQIKATGRYRGDVADNYAGLVRDFYTALSARIPGETPDSLYQKYPYRVVARDTDGAQSGVLTQGNPVTLDFDAKPEGADAFLEQSGDRAGVALGDAFFASRKSPAGGLAEAVAEVAPGFKVKKLKALSGYDQELWSISGKSVAGERVGPAVVTLDTTDNTVQLDIAAFTTGQGGNAIYQAVSDYAHNAGLKFIGDIGGLSPVAQIRRAENMLSSALRWGTTRHLGGHELMEKPQVEGVASLNWREGDDAHNTRRLIEVTRENTVALAPEAEGLTYNFEEKRFEDQAGNNVTEADFDAIAASARGRALVDNRRGRTLEQGAPIGSRTIKRAALFNSLLRQTGGGVQGVDGGRDGLLARLSELSAESSVDLPLRGVFYATADGGPQGTFDPKTLTATLLKTENLTTFLHETGHFFLTVLADVASQPGAPAGVVADMATVLEMFNVPDLATWNAMSVDQQRKHHEAFAGAWEQYLFTGKAPSQELRAAFKHFSQFLRNVYGSLKALVTQRGGTLDPSISGVFDRLLATEQAIKEAQEIANMEPLFSDAEAAKKAGITDAEFESLQRVMEQAQDAALSELQARSLRDLRWVLRTQTKALKSVAKDVKAKRDAIREEVSAEVRAMPVYAALRWFRTGVLVDGTKTDGSRLSTPELKEMFGTEKDAAWRALPFSILSSKAELTVPVNAAAEMFGFGPTGGEAFVRAIIAAPTEVQMVDALTDQRLLETYGDITSKTSMERAANEAVFNEARARAVATEYQALSRAGSTTERTPAGGHVNVVMRAAQRFAERLVGEQAVRDIKPLRHTAAASRAAKRTAELQAKGDTAGAIKAKREQMLQTYAARESYDAQGEVERAVAYLKKFNKADANTRIDQDYLDQINTLLEQFDLRKGTTRKDVARRKSFTAWVEQQRERGHEPVVDMDALAAAGRTSYLDLSLDEFRDVVDAVRNIEHLGRRWKTLLTAKDNRAFDATAKEISDTIRANATQTHVPRVNAATAMDDLGDWFKRFASEHRKFSEIVQQLDGGDNPAGPLWQALVRPMNERSAWEQARLNEEAVKLSALTKPVLGRRARREANIPSLGRSLSLETRIVAALNWGNLGNRQRLMSGDGWSGQTINQILGTLTSQELGFVNDVWAYVDSFWPEIAAKEKRVTGVEPERVEATPFVVKSADGAMVDMRGGYYALRYDPLRSGMSAAHDKAEAARATMHGAYTRAYTRRSHARARADSVTGRALDKNLTGLFTHVNQVVHDLAWHEWLIDANRLLDPKGTISAAIQDTVGPHLLRELTDTLPDIAGGNVEVATANEIGWGWVRTGATIASMGWNLNTAALQPLGLLQSIQRIGPRWVGVGLAKWLGSAARMENVTKSIYAKSPMMKNRSRTFHTGVAEVRNQARGRKGAVRTNTEASFFYFIAKMQQVADIPTWLGQYEKTLTTTGDEGLAVAQADQAVIDAQTSATVENLARIQRGGPLARLFTNFMSYANGTYNRGVASWHKTNFKNPAQATHFAVDMMLLMTLPATLAALLRMALKGDPPEDEEELVKALAVENLTYLMGMFVGPRELSGVVAGFSGYSGPAGTRVFDDLSKFYEQSMQGEMDEAWLTSGVGAAGVLFHFPSGQLNRMITGYVAASEGDAPPTAMMFGKPRKD